MTRKTVSDPFVIFGLTTNQSSVIEGENYIVVNYEQHSRIKKIWVLWQAQDGFFSPKRANSNARTIGRTAAAPHIQVIYEAPKER